MIHKIIPPLILFQIGAEGSAVGVFYTLVHDIDEAAWINASPVTKPNVR
jgi:hypothetical protein